MLGTILGYLALLEEPIAAIVKLIEQDDHSPEQEQEVLYAMQRAIFNARAKRKFDSP